MGLSHVLDLMDEFFKDTDEKNRFPVKQPIKTTKNEHINKKSNNLTWPQNQWVSNSTHGSRAH